MLTPEAIQELATRSGVKKVAVENFLSTMGDNFSEALANFVNDANSYGWNGETVQAIAIGIALKFNVPKPKP